MLQLGGLPQWWPLSQALQWQLQPEPALASDTRIADQLLSCSDHLRGWEQSSLARTHINICRHHNSSHHSGNKGKSTPMTDERAYPAGVTCWVDTEQPDLDAARRFYAALFGWTFIDAAPAEAPGTYLIASLDGAVVAAIGQPQGDAPVEWNTYIAVDDADAAAAAVRAAGGSVTPEPVDAGPGDGWRPVSILGVHASACGSRDGGWEPNSPTRPVAGTSAICTPATRPLPPGSTHRYSVGSSTTSASRR
jgi:predicted enzyme related to lactoylglutathione lyase